MPFKLFRNTVFGWGTHGSDMPSREAEKAFHHALFHDSYRENKKHHVPRYMENGDSSSKMGWETGLEPATF